MASISSVVGLLGSAALGHGLRPVKRPHRRMPTMVSLKRILKVAQLAPFLYDVGIWEPEPAPTSLWANYCV